MAKVFWTDEMRVTFDGWVAGSVAGTELHFNSDASKAESPSISPLITDINSFIIRSGPQSVSPSPRDPSQFQAHIHFPCLSKILERVVSTQLFKVQLNSNNLFHPSIINHLSGVGSRGKQQRASSGWGDSKARL
ncbi:hypothetical protein NQZ68_020859 [Dissostichus eleginoides]|nr:hypothetical protein NQZ68_020859 [Dissostichus eleginoides]